MTLKEKTAEIETHFNLWIGAYNRKERTTNSIRITAEAICKAVLISKLGEIPGTEIILGKNKSIPKGRKSGYQLKFSELIQTLSELKYIDKNIELQLDLIRNRTNPGSHSTNVLKDEIKPEDLDVCHSSVKYIVSWFYKDIMCVPVPDNIQKMLEGEEQLELTDLPNEKWRELELACHHFDKRRFQYIFVSPENISDEQYTVEAFAKLPWRLVLDFNPKTDEVENGLLFNFNRVTGQGYKKAFTIEDRIEFDLNFPHYWFLANGQGAVAPLPDHMAWRNRYRNFLSEGLFRPFVKGSRIKSRIVVLLNIPENFAIDIVDEFNRVEKKDLQFILCSEKENYERLFSIADNVKLISISPVEIANGINNSISFEEENPSESKILVPNTRFDKNNVGYIPVSQDHFDYLHSLGIEIIYKGIEKSIPSDDSNAFFRGNTISWRDLAEQKDLHRTASKTIQKRLESKLEENRLEDIQLIHEAGAGGTTLSRRIAFDLSHQYPTVVLRKFINKKTIDALRILTDQYTRGSLPLFIVIESFEVKDSHLVYRDLSNAKKNAVILIVHRGAITKAKNKKFILKAELEGMEITAFENAFKERAPEMKDKILDIQRAYRTRPKYISPILYALTAFGKEYNGLESYTSKCLDGITLEQKKLAGFICLIYYYTQKSVPGELFSSLFNIDRSKCDLTELLGNENPLFELLHQEANAEDEYYNVWRPRYALLGEEAMQIILAGGEAHKANWRNNLAQWLIDLISYIEKAMPTLDDDTSQILKALFIERSYLDDNNRGKEFTRAIYDLQGGSTDGIAVFDALTSAYPNEAHFHGHYARYLYSDAIGIKDYDKAVAEAELSLEIWPDNSSLIHTLGMCYSEKAEDLMRNYEKKEITPEDAEENVQILTEHACDRFDDCINRDTYNIYGYESQIRLILKTLDFGFKIHGATTKESFITNPDNNWYAEKLDKVSRLLEEALYVIEQFKRLENRERTEKSEGYILDCESIFFKTLGRHLAAKSKFEDLIKNTPRGYEFMRPHYRRMFVMCLLASKAPDQRAIFESWSEISESELAQCVEYLDANFFEDPYNTQNIKLWFQAVRHQKHPPSVVNCISRIGAWVQAPDQNDNSLLSGYYYLYVLNAIKAISEGNSFDPTTVQTVKEVLEKMKPFMKNEKFCYEWYGAGTGIHQMVNHRELGDFTSDFFEKNRDKLMEVTGRIKIIQSSQQGIITLDCGLEAFFVPNIHGFTERNNKDRVKCYIGFRYDQIQAWSVLLVTAERDQSIKKQEAIEVYGSIEETEEPEEELSADTEVPEVTPAPETAELPKLAGPKIVGKIDLIPAVPKPTRKVPAEPAADISYKGSIKKIHKGFSGYITAEDLNKDIAFNKWHLKGLNMHQLRAGTEVTVKVNFTDEKPQTDTSGKNYIAKQVEGIRKK